MALEKNSYLDELPKVESYLPNSPLVQYNGFWCFPDILKCLPIIESQYKSLPTDVLISSFPKSGTTWLKAITFEILRNQTTNDQLQTHNPHQLVPFLESEVFGENSTWKIDDISSPRIFGTHLPYSLLPKNVTESSSGCKIIHISRNPADVIISGWNFRVKSFGSQKTLQEDFDQFIKGLVLFGPLLEYDLEYWNVREKENMLFVTYEGLKKYPNENVKRIAEFLGCALSDDEVEQVVRKTSFERLSKLSVNTNEESKVAWPEERTVLSNSFFRNGNVGDGKKCFTPEMIERLDAAVQQTWGGTGLDLLYTDL